MNNKKTTRRALFSSIMALLLCCSMLVGTTFAWFTDSVTSTGNIIKSGTLDVEMKWANDLSEKDTEKWTDASVGAIFNYQYWEPGYTEVKYVNIANKGDLAFQYQLNIVPAVQPVAGQFNLADVIEAYLVPVTDIDTFAFDRADADTFMAANDGSTLSQLMADPDGAAYGVMLPVAGAGNYELTAEDAAIAVTGNATYCVVLHMQESAGNEYQNLSVGDGFSVQLLATQLAAEVDSFGPDYDSGAAYPELKTADEWDGTYDTAWYFENPTADTFTLNSAEQLAGLASLVDGGAVVPASVVYDGLPVTFDGQTILLAADVDLYMEDANGEPVSFDPIGYGYDVVFKGTFDGQGHTISNLYQNGWALGYANSTEAGGLFASVVDATIKNLTIDGADIVMNCIDMGTLVGYSYGNCTYENIKISNSTIANYQRYTGGVVGEVNGTQTFKNVDVDATCTVSSLWGDFDASLGGIVGGKYGEAKLTFEDCDVACVINAVNDVVSTYNWYAYRRAGMLIGNSEETTMEGGRKTATASYLTATNCTVTYGDWANYTYCRFSKNATGTQASYPWVRVQAGDACGQCGAYSNVRYGVAMDANGNKVTDDNHVHGEGEEHNKLIAFDQLFGGGQGVYGTATHDGVTVVYNNK